MKSEEYSRLVYRGAFLMSACDGEIADSELAELESAGSMLFDLLDTTAEADELRSEIDTSLDAAIDRYLKQAGSIKLNEAQQINLVRLLVRIACADGKIAIEERQFLLSLIDVLRDHSEGDGEFGPFAGLVGPVFRDRSDRVDDQTIPRSAYNMPKGIGDLSLE